LSQGHRPKGPIHRAPDPGSLRMRGNGRRIEIDYAQVAAEVGMTGARGRDVEKAVREAIKSLEARFPGQRVVLMNKPGSIIEVEGGRKYLVNRAGDMTQLSGEPLQLRPRKIG
jgi:hypothetical protein